MEAKMTFFSRVLRYVAAPVIFSVLGGALMWTAAHWIVGDVKSYTELFLHDSSLHGYEFSDTELEVMDQAEMTHDDVIYVEDVEFPKRGSVYGRIEIEAAGIDCPLIYGDDEKYLKNGAGQSSASYIVGYGGTTIIAAHNTRHFMSLPQVREGDVIRISTHYGTYLYRVTETRVLSHLDSSAYDMESDKENVVLYTCYYEDSILGNVKKRLFVYGEYIENYGDELSSPVMVSKLDTAPVV